MFDADQGHMRGDTTVPSFESGRDGLIYGQSDAGDDVFGCAGQRPEAIGAQGLQGGEAIAHIKTP
jgi:hypothetical protein